MCLRVVWEFGIRVAAARVVDNVVGSLMVVTAAKSSGREKNVFFSRVESDLVDRLESKVAELTCL